MLGVRPSFDLESSMAGPGRGGLSIIIDFPNKMNVAVRPKAFGGFNDENVMYEMNFISLGDFPKLQLGSIHPIKLHATIEATEDCYISEFQLYLEETRPVWFRASIV